MPLVGTKEMFEKAYKEGYAIGAFNVNNMEIIQGITEAAAEERAPLILQVSNGARKYAKPIYLKKLVEAAVYDTGLPIALHLDHDGLSGLQHGCVSLRNRRAAQRRVIKGGEYLLQRPAVGFFHDGGDLLIRHGGHAAAQLFQRVAIGGGQDI